TYPAAWGAPPSHSIDLDLRQQRYVGERSSSTQLSTYTQFAAELNFETQSPGFSYKINALGQGAFERSDEFYFGIPEFYMKPRQLAPGIDLTIGRQKRVWSELDQEFNLGVWQPQLRWDYLAPIQQGLTGVFFDIS